MIVGLVFARFIRFSWFTVLIVIKLVLCLPNRSQMWYWQRKTRAASRNILGITQMYIPGLILQLLFLPPDPGQVINRLISLSLLKW